MSKKLLSLLLFLFIHGFLFSQVFSKKQSFRIFTVDLKAKDVVGNNKFNDLGIKHFTSVINDLTDDTTSFLGRLGTVRLNSRDYTDGNTNLFNLSTSNHIGGYPLLDSIDFTFYREKGFQILESKEPVLITDTNYRAFKERMCNTSNSLLDRRNYLWLDVNHTYRDKLLSTRYFINVQPITLDQKISKKVTTEVKTVLKTDLNSLLKIASHVKDTVTHQKVDSVGLAAYFDRTINRTINLRGLYLSIVFQDDYIKRIKYIIENIPDNNPFVTNNDEFNNNLRLYVPNTQVALNSALFAFKFSGGLDKRLTSVDSIKSDLSAFFNIGAAQAASLATNANFMFSSHLEETYNNQFSKVWLIMFGTDALLDKLRFSNTPVIVRNNQ